jgi:hypothetical protein
MDGQPRALIRDSWQLYEETAKQPFLVRPSIPVLFFGDSNRYLSSEIRVITVGLNPSKAEFPREDRFRRFRRAESVYPGILGGVKRDAYVQSLNRYFRECPYDWFDCHADLLAGLDCSYYDNASNVALHTDICSPLATDPTWSKLATDPTWKKVTPEIRRRFTESGTKLWHSLVEWLSPHVLVVSVARKYVCGIRFRQVLAAEVLYTVPRKNPYRVEISKLRIADEKDAYLVFGQAAQTPFGTVSRTDRREIGVALRRRLRSRSTQ